MCHKCISISRKEILQIDVEAHSKVNNKRILNQYTRSCNGKIAQELTSISKIWLFMYVKQYESEENNWPYFDIQ